MSIYLINQTIHDDVNAAFPVGRVACYDDDGNYFLDSVVAAQLSAEFPASVAAFEAAIGSTLAVFESSNVAVYLGEKNSGVVKINDHAGAWGFTPFVANVEQQILVTFPLVVSSVTDWPANNLTQLDDTVFDVANGKWLENSINLQAHTWRVIVNFSRSNASQSEGVAFKIRNPISGFEIVNTGTVQKGQLTGKAGITLLTIADSASIGVGYQLFLETTDDMDIEIDSITLISHKRDNTD